MKNTDEEGPSYLQAMLTHEWNVLGFAGSLALGGVLAMSSLTLGAVPLIAFGTAEVLAALFVPSSASFRHMVDKKQREVKRNEIRAHLEQEIKSRPKGKNDAMRWQKYHNMCKRIQSLIAMASNSNTSLSLENIEQLQDVTVDFLSLWQAQLVMQDRHKSFNPKDLQGKIADINKSLEDESTRGTDRTSFMQAKMNLEKVLSANESLVPKMSAIEAKMMSIASDFAEMYQSVMVNPTSGDAAKEMRAAVDRMRIEEAIDAEINI